ncbi:MAG TPA: hypothetical protein VMX74_02975 [Pirellulales bacterium]|nr:hypothetical protein [Pirellulales bacterium]
MAVQSVPGLEGVTRQQLGEAVKILLQREADGEDSQGVFRLCRIAQVGPKGRTKERLIVRRLAVGGCLPRLSYLSGKAGGEWKLCDASVIAASPKYKSLMERDHPDVYAELFGEADETQSVDETPAKRGPGRPKQRAE